LLATAAIRSRLLERVSVLIALNALAVAFVVVTGEIALFEWVGGRTALTAVGSVIIALAALLAGRVLLGSAAEHRERMRTHATMGRMSQQMAHDLKNPLAAIRGAAQLLQAEHAAGRSLDPHAKYVDLIVDQTERVTRVIDDYQRIGRV